MTGSIDAFLGSHFTAGSELSCAVEREQARSLLLASASHDAARVRRASLPAGESGVLLAEAKPWEERFFNCSVFQVSLFASSAKYDARRALAESLLSDWVDAQRAGVPAYLVVRIAAEDVAFAHALERQGFASLVPMVTLERGGGGDTLVSTSAATDAGSVQPDEVESLAEIAREAFLYGRFWVEPDLGQDVAGAMHADWARNCCTTALADDVLVARVGGAPVGFIAMRTRRYGAATVDEINLIAVAAPHRGQGVGRLLVEAGRRWSQDHAGTLLVRTELPNTAAVRLYEGSGFRLGNGSLYYRRWLGRDRGTASRTGAHGQ